MFVQNVEAPALSIINPILTRGLIDKTTATKRVSCVIVDNMCKLIEHPKEILPFYSTLKTRLEYCNDTLSDPEASKVCARSLNTLKSICTIDENTSYKKDTSEFFNLIQEQLTTNNIIINDIDHDYLSILVTKDIIG